MSGLLSCCHLTFDEFTEFLLKDIVKRTGTLKAYMDECQLELKYSKSRPEHVQYSCVAGQWAFRLMDCKKEIEKLERVEIRVEKIAETKDIRDEELFLGSIWNWRFGRTNTPCSTDSE